MNQCDNRHPLLYQFCAAPFSLHIESTVLLCGYQQTLDHPEVLSGIHHCEQVHFHVPARLVRYNPVIREYDAGGFIGKLRHCVSCGVTDQLQAPVLFRNANNFTTVCSIGTAMTEYIQTMKLMGDQSAAVFSRFAIAEKDRFLHKLDNFRIDHIWMNVLI